MGEYENNSTTNNYTSENDLASCHGPRTKKTDEESNLRPSDSALRCPTTEHIVFTVIKVYYEFYITRVLHIARISNVIAACFVNRIIKMSSKFAISLILSFIG